MSRANPARKHLSAVLILAFLALDFAGCASFRAARLYNEGTDALNLGDYEIAISRLDRAGQLAPRASEIQNHLGLAFASTGQHEKALSAFEKAVDLDCSNSAAVHNLASERASAQSQLKTGLKTDTISEQVP
ncbi:MAG: tetratricopeptide repeat protein [Myxococcales bacterium]|nr:tetratricopeptide repeat protein [Myxococcales bacterium]